MKSIISSFAVLACLSMLHLSVATTSEWCYDRYECQELEMTYDNLYCYGYYG